MFDGLVIYKASKLNEWCYENCSYIKFDFFKK